MLLPGHDIELEFDIGYLLEFADYLLQPSAIDTLNAPDDTLVKHLAIKVSLCLGELLERFDCLRMIVTNLQRLKPIQ